MRLINTSTLELEEFISKTPPYAILSHRWGAQSEEVTFKDHKKGLKLNTSGWRKICNFCKQACKDGYEWAWVDTCCIDKRSSAELSESINSMYKWYQEAEVCYVFLEDVDESRSWEESEWWQRGWTLQELIAPGHVVFYDKEWRRVGSKFRMAEQIEQKTGIPVDVLGKIPLQKQWTIAQKMSWAAGRRTTRVEDTAYCLLGLFRINMPLLYGEGKKAFQRLQLEILQKYPDESVFAWQSDFQLPHYILADHPDRFENCSKISSDGARDKFYPGPGQLSPPRVTSQGIEWRAKTMKLIPRESSYPHGRFQEILWAVIPTITLLGVMQDLPCVLILVRSGFSSNTYRRVKCHHYSSEDIEQNLRLEYNIREWQRDRILYLAFDSDLDADPFV